MRRVGHAALVICVQAWLGSKGASRVRERIAARDLALLRKIALKLARADTSLKASLKGKCKSAVWDNGFMAMLVNGWSHASALRLTGTERSASSPIAR